MLNRIIDIGIFSTLFFSAIVLSKQPFEFYISYIPMVLLLPIFIVKFKFPAKVLYLLIPLLVTGLLNVYFDNNTMKDFLKIFLNIFVAVLFFNYVFQYYAYDVKRIFGMYMKGCVVVAIIGLIQVASYSVGFKAGYDFHVWGFNKWSLAPGGLGVRLNGIFSEPSYFGATVGPAFFVSVINLLYRRNYFIKTWQCLVIVIAYLLTFSSVAYLGILTVMILYLMNIGFIRYTLIVIPLIAILGVYAYNNVEEFRTRADGLKALYVDNILDTEGASSGNNSQLRSLLEKVHGSSFVQYNNYKVAVTNFKKNPFFGTGLGSHQTAFQQYNVLDYFGGLYDFNSSDANSMFLRLLSETGLFGILFMILFIRFGYIKMPPEGDEEDLFWLISNATLVMIILQLVRQGNYTYNGFFFYMWLYYFNSLAQREKEEQLAAEQKPEEEPHLNPHS